MSQRGWRLTGVVLICGLASSLAGQQATTVELHGFGTWSYGNSSGNDFVTATKDGEYQNASLALNLQAQPDERLHISSQVEWVQGPDGSEVELDYVFAEWQISDALHLRAGKVKNPFGLSSEVFDVGTLRPFVALPQAFYGPVGLTAEGYFGVGISGRRAVSGRWELAYDLYFGSVRKSGAAFDVPTTTAHDVDKGELLTEALGGRLVLETPVEGLSFGVSALSGQHDDEDGDFRDKQWGLQAQYLSGPWSLRAEWARHSEPERHADAGYVELARRLGAHLQVAAQYGRRDGQFPDVSASERALLEHEEWALGLDWWFSSSLVAKLSYHDVDGNLLARPADEELRTQFLNGDLARRTRALLASVQFAF